jgi:SEC-C motif-containing protein
MINRELCPCGSVSLYALCCGPLISGEQEAQTAEQLMRSRYSAYTKAEVDYIIATTHPDYREDYNPQSIRQWAETSEWQKLEIIRTEKGGESDNEGWVEFIAYYSEKKTDKQHHELSYFKKTDGSWYFFSGTTPVKPQITTLKAGRNEPCPCGSGKKYKKCHGFFQ